MDAEEAASNFGAKFLKAPWGMFKTVLTILFGATALIFNHYSHSF
jgi:hypothetical protein